MSLLFTAARSLRTVAGRRAASTTAQSPLLKGWQAEINHNMETYKTWKNISFFIALPLTVIVAIRTFMQDEDLPDKENYVKYEHLRLRLRSFPWGDDTLMHNPHVNAGADGYEGH